MKFTRDICRLLGLGGGEEQMEVQGGAPDPADPRKDQSSAQEEEEEGEEEEEEEEEEERTRRRAERRRAKKRRQKQRKKERTEDASEGGPVGEEVNEAVSESDSEEEEEGDEEEEEWTAVPPRNRCHLDPVPVAVAREKSSGPRPRGTSEEEPVWDVSSAFVANAVSHIRNLKGLKTKTTQTREDQDNEGGQVESREVRKRRGESLTVQGIQMFGRGRYSHAVDMFTAAIHCDPTDHRFYGNRSCCLWCLQRFPAALADAHRAVQLAPDWPKGHFRKGCALMGLKRFREAEASMLQVLLLDGSCKEASRKLLSCRALQLAELGSEEAQSKALLEEAQSKSSAAVPPAATRGSALKQDQSGSCRSLWVGNITLEVTERDVLSLFEMAGEIESVRVLHKRSCAFVNFKNANMAARALERLQGAELGSGRLVMRYPNRRTRTPTTPTTPTTPMTPTTPTTPQPRTNAAGTQQSSAAKGSRRCVPINGDECFYWRTSGCFYGDACRFKHTADQRGRDKKPWQP